MEVGQPQCPMGGLATVDPLDSLNDLETESEGARKRLIRQRCCRMASCPTFLASMSGSLHSLSNDRTIGLMERLPKTSGFPGSALEDPVVAGEHSVRCEASDSAVFRLSFAVIM